MMSKGLTASYCEKLPINCNHLLCQSEVTTLLSEVLGKEVIGTC
jgi:hypothetical protein